MKQSVKIKGNYHTAHVLTKSQIKMRKKARSLNRPQLVAWTYELLKNQRLTPVQTRIAIKMLFGMRISMTAIYSARQQLRAKHAMTQHDRTARMF
jgi:hypothetical protein